MAKKSKNSAIKISIDKIWHEGIVDNIKISTTPISLGNGLFYLFFSFRPDGKLLNNKINIYVSVSDKELIKRCAELLKSGAYLKVKIKEIENLRYKLTDFEVIDYYESNSKSNTILCEPKIRDDSKSNFKKYKRMCKFVDVIYLHAQQYRTIASKPVTVHWGICLWLQDKIYYVDKDVIRSKKYDKEIMRIKRFYDIDEVNADQRLIEKYNNFKNRGL